MVDRSKLGQYFTKSELLQEEMYKFILNEPSTILEPCIGQGDLIKYIKSQNSKIKFDMYEIDKEIKIFECIAKKDIKYGDFLKQTINQKYKTIIGNPPYVKIKTGNLYIDFIKKCYDLLETNGELIFIIPSDFFKLTCASKLLNVMMTNGTFTHIYHPNDETLFKNASIDVIIFRYCKTNNVNRKILYNNKIRHIVNSNGLIKFEEEENKNTALFKDYFDIYVGLVSGKECVYKNENLGNIEVLNGEGKNEKYIYIEKYPCDNEKLNQHLMENKAELIERKIKRFNEKNWFEWGAPRNINMMKTCKNEECIYINTLTRKSNVCFRGKVQMFGGGLIMLKPKQKCNLISIVSYLNGCDFKTNFTYSGRFKIGHRQICNSFIPNKILSDCILF